MLQGKDGSFPLCFKPGHKNKHKSGFTETFQTLIFENLKKNKKTEKIFESKIRSGFNRIKSTVALVK